MSSQAQAILAAGMPSRTPPIIAARPRSPSLLQRVLVFPVKLFWGMAFCQGLVGSILVVGWTYRLAQRSVLKYWWLHSQRPQESQNFADFLAESDRTRPCRHWPNWFFQQDFLQTIRAQPTPAKLPASVGAAERSRHGASGITHSLSRLARAPVHSLWLNLWIGLRAVSNTWVLSLPAGLFWWFGWYDGWNNSFNKGYEQAAVGPLISIFGVLWFIAAMFYVPLAQARQAATGDWRSFYQFRLVWRIVRLRWLSCVGLALLYSSFALPLNILKTAPMFWPKGKPTLETLPTAEALKHLDGYFFWCALVVLPAYVILRLLAARIYASGILSLVQTGNLEPASLAQNEREALERLELIEVRPQPQRHLFVRLIAWTGTRLGRLVSAGALVLIWFSFVAQIYIAEFLMNHRAIGWLNQPLVQLPWFRYLPAGLKNPAGEVFGALLVFLALLLMATTLRRFRAGAASLTGSGEKGTAVSEEKSMPPHC